MFIKGYLSYIFGIKITSWIYAGYLILRFGIKGAQKEIDRQNRLIQWQLKGGKFKGF
jgi:hypothetical protein